MYLQLRLLLVPLLCRFQGRMLLVVCHRGAAAGEELTIRYAGKL
jgi:hypothetical protein